MTPVVNTIVVITRPRSIRGSSDEILNQFAAVRAEIRWVPFIELEILPEALQEIEIEKLRLATPSCLAFTSSNAVEVLCETLQQHGATARELPSEILIAAQGEETARTVERELGRSPAFVPSSPLSAVFGAELAAHLKDGSTVFYPTSREAGLEFEVRVAAAGHSVVRWDLYTPRPRVLTPDDWAFFFNAGKDALMLIFMSPSAVREAKRQVPPQGHSVWDRIQIVTIGPVTSSAVREVGWKVDYESLDQSVQGIVRLLNEVVNNF